VRRGVPWAAAGLVCAGVAVLVLLPGPQPRARGSSDYLPDDGTFLPWSDPLLGAVLGALLTGAGVLLITVWMWLHHGSQPGRHRSLLRDGVPGVGAALLLAGLIGGWIADWMQPGVAFGWYLYPPLSTPITPPTYDDPSRALHGLAATFAALGLGMLTAVAAFRAGRRETTGPAER
jgi:hypothetical protein